MLPLVPVSYALFKIRNIIPVVGRKRTLSV